MERTFHYKITWLNIISIGVVAAAMVYFLWNRSTGNVIVGIALMCVAMLMIERIIHTEYVFASDGFLYIKQGRLSRTQAIRVDEIITIRVIKARLMPLKFVFIEYGAGHQIAVQPVNETAFIEEVRRRQTKTQNQNLQS